MGIQPFIWEKKGRIYSPETEHTFIKSHAQIPTPIYLKDKGLIRIYVATRPEGNQSQISFIDVDAQNPTNVVYRHDKGVIEYGKPGMFDEHGVMPNFALKNDDKVWLYYIGWSRRDSIPYSNWAGLAFSSDNGQTFIKNSPAPVMDRNNDELFSAAICNVMIEDGKWHCWYASGIDWVMANGKYAEIYSIKHAVSDDGIIWVRDKHFCITPANDWEAITRPTVVKIEGVYYMWFCYRGSGDFRDGGESYRIGFAWSADMVTWHRDDAKAGISISENGWDSKMMAYPYVIKVEEKYLMFYNGNYFGKEGFGYAELKLTK